MKTPASKFQDLHDIYCKLSKMPIPLRFNREQSWHEFTRCGFTKADLEMVMNRLVALIERGERKIESLKFSNVVEQLDRFEEELYLGRAWAEGKINAVERQLTVYELRHVLEAKIRVAEFLENAHSFQDSFGLRWDDDNARSEHRKIRAEIRAVEQRIANMA